MEPVSTTALAKVAPEIEQFAEQITAGGRREASEWLGDVIRSRRVKTQLKVLNKAQEAAVAAGFSPKVVATKTLVPLLEAASLEDEDDEDMVSRWAALLANASQDQSLVPPTFAELLKQMTSLDARILDAVYDHAQAIDPSDWLRSGITPRRSAAAFGASSEQVSLAVDNLIRLRLCSLPAGGFEFTDGDYQYVIAAGTDILCLTDMGAAFVRACRSPQ